MFKRKVVVSMVLLLALGGAEALMPAGTQFKARITQGLIFKEKADNEVYLESRSVKGSKYCIMQGQGKPDMKAARVFLHIDSMHCLDQDNQYHDVAIDADVIDADGQEGLRASLHPGRGD